MRQEFEFVGAIGRVTPAGNGAVVVLDKEVGGVLYAVINFGTRGRIALMNETGTLVQGQRICGTGYRGPDALCATFVSALPPPGYP